MLSEKSDRSADVFEKDEGRSALSNNAGRIGPKIPLVARSQALAGGAVGLARDARSDAIHDAAPRSPVEGSEIRPANRRTQAEPFMRRRQYLASEAFPLHHTDRSSRRQGQFDSEFEPASAGAQREDVESVRLPNIHATLSLLSYTGNSVLSSSHVGHFNTSTGSYQPLMRSPCSS